MAASTGLLQRTVTRNAPTGDEVQQENEPQVQSAISSLTKRLVEMSGGKVHPLVVRRKVARLLAAKSTLAVRADCYRRMDPFASGSLEVSEELESGDYGAVLGERVQRKLKVWAERNGIHLERTVEELQVGFTYGASAK